MQGNWQQIEHDIKDDGGLLFDVEKADNGIIRGKVRVYGVVEIDGREYSYDKYITVRLKKDGGE